MTQNVNLMSELEITTAALSVGWVKFSYMKADGSKRIAIGTTNRVLIEQVRGYALPEYRENKSYYARHGYFDLTRCDWRQFNEERFIGLELERLTNKQAVSIAVTILYAETANGGQTDEGKAAYSNLLSCGARLIGDTEMSEIKNLVCHIYCDEVYGGHAYISDREMEHAIAVVSVSAPKSEPIVESKPMAAKQTTDRSALIAELKRLRERETEILAQLLA